MHDQWFGDVLRDGHQRVERAARILEHKADVGTFGFEITLLDTVHLDAKHIQRTAGNLLQARDGTAGGGFAGTGFAHQAKYLGTVDGEVNTVHGFEIRLHQMARIRDGQPLGLDRDGLLAPILLALDDLAFGVLDDELLTDTRHCREQTLGVIVLWRIEDLLDATLFDDVAAVHNHDFVGDIGDHSHIVGDDEH